MSSFCQHSKDKYRKPKLGSLCHQAQKPEHFTVGELYSVSSKYSGILPWSHDDSFETTPRLDKRHKNKVPSIKVRNRKGILQCHRHGDNVNMSKRGETVTIAFSDYSTGDSISDYPDSVSSLKENASDLRELSDKVNQLTDRLLLYEQKVKDSETQLFNLNPLLPSTKNCNANKLYSYNLGSTSEFSESNYSIGEIRVIREMCDSTQLEIGTLNTAVSSMKSDISTANEQCEKDVKNLTNSSKNKDLVADVPNNDVLIKPTVEENQVFETLENIGDRATVLKSQLKSLEGTIAKVIEEPCNKPPIVQASCSHNTVPHVLRKISVPNELKISLSFVTSKTHSEQCSELLSQIKDQKAEMTEMIKIWHECMIRYTKITDRIQEFVDKKTNSSLTELFNCQTKTLPLWLHNFKCGHNSNNLSNTGIMIQTPKPMYSLIVLIATIYTTNHRLIIANKSYLQSRKMLYNVV